MVAIAGSIMMIAVTTTTDYDDDDDDAMGGRLRQTKISMRLSRFARNIRTST